MNYSHQSASAHGNLIGYPFSALPSGDTRARLANGNLLGYPNGFLFATGPHEVARSTRRHCHLLGDNDEETQSEARGYRAEVCHLVGDMLLEDDCA